MNWEDIGGGGSSPVDPIYAQREPDIAIKAPENPFWEFVEVKTSIKCIGGQLVAGQVIKDRIIESYGFYSLDNTPPGMIGAIGPTNVRLVRVNLGLVPCP